MTRSSISRRWSGPRNRAALVLSSCVASAACHAPAATRALVSGAPGVQDAAPPPAADVPPISTDRPGFLFAPTVLTPGRLQVETGPTYTLVRSGGDEARAWTLPIALRYGASETLELRASLPTWTETRVESGASADRDEGLGDTEVGAKLALPPLAGGPLALQGSLRLPTGADDFTTDELGASAYLLHGRDLGASFWLQTLAGATYLPIDGAEDQTSGALAALVSHPLAEGWSTYVEATALPGLNHAAGQSYLGTAVIWTPRYDVQLDLSADFGLDDDSADVIASLGLSWFF
jgi:hypothetical protein